MPKFGDALRGYGHEVLNRDGFRCQYCGFDGTTFQAWLLLSVDHLLPTGDPKREDQDRDRPREAF